MKVKWVKNLTEIKKYNETDALGTEKISRLLFRLAIPAITAQIVNLLYNVVDRMYIGHIESIGKLALTGVGICLPLILLISAFAALVGMGAAPRASIYLGKGEKNNAEGTLGNSFVLLLCVSALLTAVFFLFAEKLLLTFGASENTIGYAMQYMSIYCLGTIFVQLTIGLNPFISAQGFAKISMFTVCIGAGCNIILDPVFIFGFGLGVRGAAIATILSQAVSGMWVLRFLTGKKTTLRLKRCNMKLRKEWYLPSLALGLSPFVMQSTESLISVCFNSSLLKYGGDIAVGSMTILASVMQLAVTPLVGLMQGAQPISSYNFGAGNIVRVKKTFRLLFTICLTYSMVIWTFVMIKPEFFVHIFNNDPELTAFASRALRIYMGATGIFGIQVACQHTFIAIGNAKSSLFLALFRKVIVLVPLIYLMPAILPGMLAVDLTTAVFMAEPVADFIAVVTTATMFRIQFSKVCNIEKGDKHK